MIVLYLLLIGYRLTIFSDTSQQISLQISPYLNLLWSQWTPVWSFLPSPFFLVPRTTCGCPACPFEIQPQLPKPQTLINSLPILFWQCCGHPRLHCTLFALKDDSHDLAVLPNLRHNSSSISNRSVQNGLYLCGTAVRNTVVTLHSNLTITADE